MKIVEMKRLQINSRNRPSRMEMAEDRINEIEARLTELILSEQQSSRR